MQWRAMPAAALLAGALVTFPLPALAGGGAEKGKLESDSEKLGYAIGLEIGGSLKKLDVEIDLDALYLGIGDKYTGGKERLTAEEANEIKRRSYLKMRAADAERNLKAGEAFLAANKKKKGVVTTASGLQYEVLRQGKGRRPKATDKVRVHYEGSLLDGTVFDSSYKRGEPLTVTANRVIPGWTEALQLMPVGSKFRLFIPAELAYGEQGAGDRIGPNETLIFDVELLGIEP